MKKLQRLLADRLRPGYLPQYVLHATMQHRLNISYWQYAIYCVLLPPHRALAHLRVYSYIVKGELKHYSLIQSWLFISSSVHSDKGCKGCNLTPRRCEDQINMQRAKLHQSIPSMVWYSHILSSQVTFEWAEGFLRYFICDTACLTATD